MVETSELKYCEQFKWVHLQKENHHSIFKKYTQYLMYNHVLDNENMLQQVITFLTMHSFKKWSNPGLFFIYFRSFSNKHQYNFYNKSMWKNVNSIQYTVPGFEPTTSRSWVISHNHYTRAPAQNDTSIGLNICCSVYHLSPPCLRLSKVCLWWRCDETIANR